MRKAFTICLAVMVLSIWVTGIYAESADSQKVPPCKSSNSQFQLLSSCSKTCGSKTSCAFCSMCDKCRKNMQAMMSGRDCDKPCCQKSSEFSGKCLQTCGKGSHGCGNKSFCDKPGHGQRCGDAHGKPGPEKHFMFLMNHKDTLELSPVQLEDLKKLMMNTHKKMVNLRSEIEIDNLEIKMMMECDDIDMHVLKSKIESVAKNEARIKYLQVETKMAVKDILSSEQRQLMKKMKTHCKCPHCSDGNRYDKACGPDEKHREHPGCSEAKHSKPQGYSGGK